MKPYKRITEVSDKEASFILSYYEANIYFEKLLYRGLETGGVEKKWDETVTANSLENCLNKVAKVVRAKNYRELRYHAKKHWADKTRLTYKYYITKEGRIATEEDFELWKFDKKQIWVIECLIYIYKVGKAEIESDELKKLGIKNLE